MARLGVRADALSSVWETEPVDSRGPLWFLNMVARVPVSRPPEELLDLMMEVERQAGRTRVIRNEPRVLDLDLLLVDGLRVEGPKLTLPHPRMWERRFVMAPLAELDPDLRNRGTGLTVLGTYRSLGGRPEVRKVGVLAAPAAGPL